MYCGTILCTVIVNRFIGEYALGKLVKREETKKHTLTSNARKY